MTDAATTTIGDYLLERLHAYGVDHIFGIPGDFVITLFHQMYKSKIISPVTTCDEQGSGFAADGYARLRGLGATAQTYGVGGIKGLHTTASAFAEHVPVVVISGAPGVRERFHGPILHHISRDFDSQLKMYQEVTVAAIRLDDPSVAFSEIDRVLSAALQHKRPVYIEIPRDMFLVPGAAGHIPSVYHRAASNRESLQAFASAALDRIKNAKQPVILAGVEIQRYGLRDKLRQLLDQTQIPFASTVLGKGIITEQHPRFVGVYQGTIGPESTCKYVEESDCLITLGMVITDINLGLFSARLDLDRDIFVNAEKAVVNYTNHEAIILEDVIDTLLGMELKPSTASDLPQPIVATEFKPVQGQKLSTTRLFEAINGWLTAENPICCDNGEPLIAGADVLIRGNEGYYAPGYYTSLGFSTPMGLGIKLANPALRPVVICGDAAFQMDGVEVSTMARYGLNPIVIVMDNGGYGSERPVFDEPYVDTQRWNFARITEVVGAGKSFTAATEDELASALAGARAHTDSFVVIDVKLDKFDYSPAFKRFLARFASGV